MISISCIIPVYGLTEGNNMSYFKSLILSLVEAVKSLGGGLDFELVVVNDDKNRISEHVIRKTIDENFFYSNLRYIENEYNRGQAYSRNIGASIASGSYLHFLDQDDYVSPSFYKGIIDDNIDMYITTPYFDNNGEIKEAFTTKLISVYNNYYLHKLWFLLFSNLVYSPGQVIISKRLFKQSGGFPVLVKRGADDFAFFYTLVFDKDKHHIKLLKKSSFFYRIHPFQNSKLSDTNKSACEFMKSQTCLNFKQRLIYFQKTKNWAHIIGKIIYIIFFKRI